MRALILALPILALAGCGAFTGTSPASGPVVNGLTSPAGQLFCAINKDGGSTIVVGLIDAAASTSSVGPVAVLATNAGAAMVQHECDLAATAVGAPAAVPVSPPAAAVASVAITVPVGAPTAAKP